MQPFPEPLHRLEYKDVAFDDSYSASCAKCESFVFQFQLLDTLLKWNGLNYFLVDTFECQSGSYTWNLIDSQLIHHTSGPLIHNGTYRVECLKCGCKLGNQLVMPHFTVADFVGQKVVIPISAVRLVPSKDINQQNAATLINIDFIFREKQFTTHTYTAPPVEANKQQVNQQNQPEQLKRKHPGQKSVQSNPNIKDQLLKATAMFAKALMKTEKRINQIEVCMNKCSKNCQELLKLVSKSKTRHQS